MALEQYSEIKAVFFDFDDTLVGTIKPKWAQHRFIAKEYYAIDITDQELIEHWGMPLDQMVMHLYRTDNYEEARKYILRHREEFPKILFDASMPTILELKKQGILTGIVTATSRESIDLDFKLNKFTGEHFDYVQTLDDTNVHKPDPRVFDPAISWLGVREIEPDQAVYIGDSVKDMKAAIGAGFHFIGVETGLVTGEEFKKHGALSIPQIDMVVDILK